MTTWQTWAGRVALAAVAWGLAGCASLPGQAELGQAVPDPVFQAPAKVPNSDSKTQVLVVPGEDGPGGLAKRAELAKVMVGAVSTLLSRDSGAEVLDPSLALSAASELKKAEMYGTAVYTGPAAADFIVKPSLTFANYRADYVPASSVKQKDGKIVYTPASYTHHAEVKGSLVVYALPSLKRVKSIDFAGAVSDSNQNQGANESQGQALLKKAADGALQGSFFGANAAAKALLDLFVTRGAVVSKRVYDDKAKALFLVSIGSRDGLKAGDKVEFFRTEPAPQIPGREPDPDLEVTVTQGQVSKVVAPTSAWIYVDDAKRARKVQGGDFVKKLN